MASDVLPVLEHRSAPYSGPDAFLPAALSLLHAEPDGAHLVLTDAGRMHAIRQAVDLPCIFASAHGDLAINDYMCATLASEPTLLSPTKFHNSVHNAAVGYWTIGTGCMASSNSVSSFEATFAAGLLEAAAQCACDQQAVLLTGFDVQAVGPLASAVHSEGMLAAAMVIAPQRSERSVAAFDWSLATGPSQPVALQSDAARALQGNSLADALPIYEALARGGEAQLALPLSAHLALRLSIRPLA